MGSFAGALIITIAVTLLLSGIIPGISLDKLISQIIPGPSRIISPLLIVFFMTALGLLLTAAFFIAGERRLQARDEKQAEATREAVVQAAQRAAKAVEAAQAMSAQTHQAGSGVLTTESQTIVPERRFKVAVIGSGFVPDAAVAQLSQRAMTDVIKIDTSSHEANPDIQNIIVAEQILGYEPAIASADSLSGAKNSDVVIAVSEHPDGGPLGQAFHSEKEIALAVDMSAKIHNVASHATLVLATSGQELQASRIVSRTALSRTRLVGTTGVYERACLQMIVARELKLQPHEINVHLLGTHSGGIAPLWRYSTVRNLPIGSTVSNSKLRELTTLWKEQLKAPNHRNPLIESAAIYALTDALLGTSQSVMTCSIYLQGEYGANDIFAVVPAQLDNTGVAQVIELPLTRDEQAVWQASVSAARTQVNNVAGA